jgi:hypothetical protein
MDQPTTTTLYTFSQGGSTTGFIVPLSSQGVGTAVLYGAGGGGAGTVSNDPVNGFCQYGGSGGGGAYVTATIIATPGSSLTVSVGKGGLGGTGATGATFPAGAGAGQNATDSSISGLVSPFATLTAGGGRGGPGLETEFDGSTGIAFGIYSIQSLGGTGGIASPGIGSNGSSYLGINGQSGRASWFTTVHAALGGGSPMGGQGGYGGVHDMSYTQFFNPNGRPGTIPGGAGGGGNDQITTDGSNYIFANGGNGADGLVLIYI